MIAALAVEGLAVQRGERILFKDLAFRLSAGNALALTGRNGAGKTSLLRAIAGFIRPIAGRIAFSGEGGASLDPADARRLAIQYVGHQDALKTSRTAWEELAFQAAWTGATEAAARAAAERLDLTRLLGLEVRKLSAGQRRRLALARLAASDRSLWLLDEPMAPLDAEHRALFGEIMGEHLARGGLIIAAVHDPLPIAAETLTVAP
jgi:heme exporter protein A